MDDRKPRENDMTGVPREPGAAGTGPGAGDGGSKPIPDPTAAWRGSGGGTGETLAGADSGPAKFSGAGIGDGAESSRPETAEDRRHVEAQRLAVEGQRGTLAGRVASRPVAIGALAVVALFVIVALLS
jgi:hypothetical protein